MWTAICQSTTANVFPRLKPGYYHNNVKAPRDFSAVQKCAMSRCTHMSTYKHWGDERIETGVVGRQYVAAVTRPGFVHAGSLNATCATLGCSCETRVSDGIDGQHVAF
jgi:hypothetical protein